MARKTNGSDSGKGNGGGEKPPAGAEAPRDVAAGGEEKRQPFHRIRMRNVSAAIWQNSSDRGPWYSVSVSRSYRDDQGNWHSADTFSGADLLILAEVARAAFEWVIKTTQNPSNAVQAAAAAAGPVKDEEIPF